MEKIQWKIFLASQGVGTLRISNFMFSWHWKDLELK